MVPSWTGFNPALVPNRTPPFRENTCPGPAVEPDLFLPGLPPFGKRPAPGPVAFENVYPTPGRPPFGETPAPGPVSRVVSRRNICWGVYFTK